MYWVSHVTAGQEHESALRALEAFLNDEAEYIEAIVHISPQYPDDESELFPETSRVPEPVAFTVVLRITD